MTKAPSIERIENLYAWAVAWNADPALDGRDDLVEASKRQREEFRAAIAEAVRAAREEGWDACQEAIDEHISRHGTSTQGWPQNPYRAETGRVMESTKVYEAEGLTVVLRMVDQGEPYEYVTRYGEKKMIRINRRWEVVLDTERIGIIEYRLITRVIQPRRSRIATKRWKSPGWEYASLTDSYPRFEALSRKDAIERIVRDYKWKHNLT